MNCPAVVGVVISLLGLVTAAACGHGPARDLSQSDQGTGVRDVDTASISDLLTAIGNTGLPIPNPRDVTDRDCPQMGCQEKVETDTVSIAKFPWPGSARAYADRATHVYQVADVVLSFSRWVSPDEEPAYVRAVERTIK